MHLLGTKSPSTHEISGSVRNDCVTGSRVNVNVGCVTAIGPLHDRGPWIAKRFFKRLLKLSGILKVVIALHTKISRVLKLRF